MDTLHWVAVVDNIADALTKANITLFCKLNEILESGVWNMKLKGSTELNGDEWR